MDYKQQKVLKNRLLTFFTTLNGVKETVNMRRIEFLNATANEMDMQIVGKEGRAAILREVAKGLQMPVDDIVPSREKEKFTDKVKNIHVYVPEKVKIFVDIFFC